jgi:hypothetical protein
MSRNPDLPPLSALRPNRLRENSSRVWAADKRRCTRIEDHQLELFLSAFISVYPRLRSFFQQSANTEPNCLLCAE